MGSKRLHTPPKTRNTLLALTMSSGILLGTTIIGTPALADDSSGNVVVNRIGGDNAQATVLDGGNGGAGSISRNNGRGAAAVTSTAPVTTTVNGAASGPGGATRPGQVVVGGIVPDDATKAAVLARVQALYGADNVQDQITVGNVSTPANWSGNVQKLLAPNLKTVHRGQLKIDGTQIDIRGEVGNEAQRQQVASEMAVALNPTFTIRNGLRVAAPQQQQNLLDRTLANRTIEFEIGSSVLAPEGKAILDQMATALSTMQGTRVAIIGHTDNTGDRRSNIALSQARADAVKGYLVGRGIPAQQMDSSGVGPDQPIAPNDTAEGRARNRRIEFRAGT
ncbi:OOP family OmpA-OmpF porin [Robbsia andropogonis]|nr:OmpA family protein [Robbsia andropogonis]MCP1117289.1 OmpA family protein [Robbsia andropogonis]MCP1129316.1 OmpA family protein [Robbsia andropogonis]